MEEDDNIIDGLKIVSAVASQEFKGSKKLVRELDRLEKSLNIKSKQEVFDPSIQLLAIVETASNTEEHDNLIHSIDLLNFELSKEIPEDEYSKKVRIYTIKNLISGVRSSYLIAVGTYSRQKEDLIFKVLDTFRFKEKRTLFDVIKKKIRDRSQKKQQQNE